MVASRLAIGPRVYDMGQRALVMGILNRTPDSFYDQGATFELDDLLRRADDLVAAGADLLDVGGVKAGPGPEVAEEEELDRVVPAVAALDLPLRRARLGRHLAGVGGQGVLRSRRGRGQRHQRLRRSRLPGRLRRGRRHRRGHPHPPRTSGPRPRAALRRRRRLGDGFLLERARRAEAAGIPPDRIVLDAGLDLGKTAEQSLALLRASDRLAALGYPLLLSASNKTFLGVVFDLPIDQRGAASLAASALGVALGCRIVRVHDVAAHRQVRDVLWAILRTQGPA